MIRLHHRGSWGMEYGILVLPVRFSRVSNFKRESLSCCCVARLVGTRLAHRAQHELCWMVMVIARGRFSLLVFCFFFCWCQGPLFLVVPSQQHEHHESMSFLSYYEHSIDSFITFVSVSSLSKILQIRKETIAP